MIFNERRGLSMEGEGAAGGGTGGAGGTGGTGDAAATAAATAAAAAAAAAAATAAKPFDWKGAGGVDDVGLAKVTTLGWSKPADLLNSYISLEKVIGVPPERIIKLPTDANDKAGWDQVHTRMGRPEKPEGYASVMPPVKGLEAVTGEVAKWYHEAGISTAAAKLLYERSTAYAAEQAKVAEQTAQVAQQKGVEALKNPTTGWGEKFDANAAIVDRAAQTFGMTPEDLAGLKMTMGYERTMKFLFDIGSKIAVEGDLITGQQQAGQFGMTPEAARAEVSRLQKDKAFAQQYVSNDPKVRQDAREKMARLQQIAFPGTTEFAGAVK